ncbi:MAG: DegT/DnrJ/EryC1/StrS family aminotransferase [Myxococcales bacterium]|nr:DegT/DnrJ/EryC1/StrS family aminotransferase [Myxococcales bacterium]
MWKITLSDLRLHPDDHAAVIEVLQSNWLTMGPKTAEFEAAFAEALDPVAPPYAFAVANCTVGLHLALAALDIGPGDEVIVPSLTFVASANAALYTGATVVLADVVGPDDLTLDVDDVLAKVTPRTRAVVPVHYAGQPCDLARLLPACAQRGIAVVEDAAHSPLADAILDGAGTVRALGSCGEVGAYSFFSNKNLATGEGGMLVTRRADLAQRIRLLRSHGMTTVTLDRHKGHAYSYDVVELGWNYRLDEMRAALGLSQLRRLPEGNRRRAEVVARYHDRLAALLPEVGVPFANRLPQGRTAWHILPVVLPTGVERTPVQDSMKAAGIQTSIHYPPIHTFSWHRRSERVVAERLPHTDALAPRLLTLPLYPTLRDDEVDDVVDALRDAVRAQRPLPVVVAPATAGGAA